jgi:hypothetical protein
MEQNIASYLFRNGYCILPGIGKLTLVTTPAETDFMNSRINAPVQTIFFSNEDKNASIFNELSAVSEHLKMMLDAKGTVLLKGIGTFSKDDNDSIHFMPLQIDAALSNPVHVERVVHQHAEHTMLVGDKETTNVVMTEYFSDIPVQKSRWWIGALIIAAVAIILLIVHIAQNDDSKFSGNIISIQPGSADSTYHSVK